MTSHLEKQFANARHLQAAAIVAAGLGGLIAYARTKIPYRKACKAKKGDKLEFEKCLLKEELKEEKKNKAAMNQAMKQCPKTKNPEKCKKMVTNMMTGINKRIAKLEQKIKIVEVKQGNR